MKIEWTWLIALGIIFAWLLSPEYHSEKLRKWLWNEK